MKTVAMRCYDKQSKLNILCKCCKGMSNALPLNE
jgi:hypothetical protein